MPRIAVLADIHANLPALEAVIEHLAEVDPDEVVLAGDLVGRGPQGSAVTRRVRELGWRSIRGNHEDYVLSFRRREVPEGWLTAREWACSRWMAAELEPADVEFLDALPFTETAACAPDIRLVHGSPESYNEGLGVWTPEDRLRDHLDSIDETVLACAHTHRPISWRFGDRLIVNVGSVGMPFNGDNRAQYTLFWQEEGAWKFELQHVPYDIDAIRKIYRDTGFLEEGGATAYLLDLELQTARPHLVPFIKWAEASGHAPHFEALDDFLAFFDPTLSLREQWKRLEALREDSPES